MKLKQKITPKYWVAHDKTTDDVFVLTARKSYDEAYKAFEDEYGVGIFDEKDNFDVILIEVKQVEF